MGAVGGQPVSSVVKRIVEGHAVHLPMGHEGPRAHHRDEDFLGLDGSKSPHGG